VIKRQAARNRHGLFVDFNTIGQSAFHYNRVVAHLGALALLPAWMRE